MPRQGNRDFRVEKRFRAELAGFLADAGSEVIDEGAFDEIHLRGARLPLEEAAGNRTTGNWETRRVVQP